MSGWRLRSRGIMGALTAAALLSACGTSGSGSRQDAREPTGNYPIAASARWTTSQRLSQHTELLITARNAGTRTVPDVAVTICNVTCSPSLRALANGEGTSVAAFSYRFQMPGLAYDSRPAWIVDRAPNPTEVPCPAVLKDYSYTGPEYSLCSGGPGGAVTAYSNTWALGSLAPGHSVTFAWRLTAVQAGTFVVHWQIAAGLNGRARAVVPGSGAPPQGSFTVRVAQTPQQAYVNNNGQVVTTTP